MKKNTQPSIERQKCKIKIKSKNYQLIFKDDDIKMKAKFYWDNNMVLKGDFKLINVHKKPSYNYKLHRVEFCKKTGEMEAFISSDSSFNRIIHRLYDEDISSFSLKKNEEVIFLIYTNAGTRSDYSKKCITDKPRKGGSILIGTETK